MEVFRLRLDSNNFQSLIPTDQKVWDGTELELACRPKAASWKSPEVYVHHPLLTAGNFLRLCSGGFVVNAHALHTLQRILVIAGELLPLECQGVQYHLLNVLACANCLDDANSKWVYGKSTGAKIRIEEYQFHPDRFRESSLFKIPETARGEILTVSGRMDPYDEFKPTVEREGLTGLMFEKIWSG